MNVGQEAVRIWSTLPRKDWGKAIRMLPERMKIDGVTWPVQETVRERLRLAINARQAGTLYLGMSADNCFAQQRNQQSTAEVPHEQDTGF